MRLGVLIAAFTCICLPAPAVVAQLTCDGTADPFQLRAEGLTERLGDIVLVCTALTGDEVTANVSLLLSSPVANRMSSNGTVDVVMTAETNAGVVPIGGSPTLIGRNSIVFNGFTFTLPASGRTIIRISNVRVSNQLNSVDRAVTATIQTSGSSGLGIRQNPVTAGVPRRGLLASSTSARIVCLGSPLPEFITFSELFAAGTRSASFRLTEGFPSAFNPRVAGTNNGVRFLVRYSGFPPGARVFVPTVIAGSSSANPTSAGEFGRPPSGGTHTPTAGGSLLLALVRSADATGAGDGPAFLPGAPGGPTVAFDSVTEVSLRNGSGAAVYEVVDANPFAFESAQIPTFIGVPPISGGDPAVASAEVTFAPISTVAESSTTAPVLRFLDAGPEVDCTLLNDCRAPYFPRMLVDAQALNYSLPSGSRDLLGRHIRVVNEGGGLLNWRTLITYRNGSGWLNAFPAAGINNASVTLRALPENLAPGIYEAEFTVDGGPITGSRTFPVRLEVTPAQPAPAPQPAPEPQRPLAWQVGNAANATVVSLVPGSIATLKGARLNGRLVQVTFNDLAATVLFSNQEQINLIVPPELVGITSARMIIHVDGVSSLPQIVPLALAAPAIFPAAILNQDGFPNTPTNPEAAGNFLQVFATGLPSRQTGVISAKLHDRVIDSPAYAGPAPGLGGVQQVNFPIAEDLPAMTTELIVCGAPLSAPLEKVCSPPVPVTIRR